MEFSLTIEVRRPARDVFSYWADLERSPEWAGPVIERRKLTEGATAVGTRFLARDRFPGRTVEFEMEITGFEPNERMAAVWFEPIGGGWEATFAGSDDKTEVTLTASMSPTGVTRLLGPLMARWARRQMRIDLEAFRDRLESGAV